MGRKEKGYDEFIEMLSASQSILFRICMAFTDGSRDSINDLYQEIVKNLWLGWGDFRGESKPTTWLYRVALNTAGMELRYNNRKGRKYFVPVGFVDL